MRFKSYMKYPIFTNLLNLWSHKKVFHMWLDNLKVIADIKGNVGSYLNLLGTFGHTSKDVNEFGNF